MALGYAFVDERGARYGEDNPAPPDRTFVYGPATGPFAGQRLVVHASSWDGTLSNTWLGEGRDRCMATSEVAKLLEMDVVPGSSQFGDR